VWCAVTAILESQEGHPGVVLAQAAKFLIHYIGDIHQPLHVGYKQDKGGNLVEVEYHRERISLHRLWDYGMINQYVLQKTGSEDNWRALVTDVKGSFTKDDAGQWGKVTDPVEWAVESHAIVEAHVYDYHGDVVGDEYDQAHDHIWIERLAMGGVRLAALLNALLQ
jgi:hypothetical protein